MLYTLGEFKDDQIQSHAHTFTTKNDNTGTGNPKEGGGSNYSTGRKTTSTVDCRSGTTTHQKSLGVNFIIKY